VQAGVITVSGTAVGGTGPVVAGCSGLVRRDQGIDLSLAFREIPPE
jgi:hypothetical protein